MKWRDESLEANSGGLEREDYLSDNKLQTSKIRWKHSNRRKKNIYVVLIVNANRSSGGLKSL